MKYSIKRILHNLCHNSLLYVVIAVHFMLGAGLFIICMNYRMTSRELLEEARLKSTEGLISVETIGRGEEDDSKEDYSISNDTYLRLNTKPYTEDLEILFTQMFHAGVFLVKTEEDYVIPEWHVYFMNDSLFTYLYQTSRKEEVVYLGEEAYEGLVTAGEALQEPEAFSILLFTDGEFYIEGDVLMVNGKAYPYEVVMPAGEDSHLPYFLDDPIRYIDEYDMIDAIIFPLEDAWIPEKQNGLEPITGSFLMYRYKNTDYREDLIAQQLRIINEETCRGVYFTVPDAYKELKRQMDDYSTDMDRWLFTAVSVMLLAGVGSMGTMFLLLNKRRHLLAVSVACGSTIRRLMVETIAENFVVLFTGGILGILISPMLKRVVIYQGELRLNMAGIGIVGAAAFVFSVVSVLAGMHEIKAENVAATLKEEG